MPPGPGLGVPSSMVPPAATRPRLAQVHRTEVLGPRPEDGVHGVQTTSVRALSDPHPGGSW